MCELKHYTYRKDVGGWMDAIHRMENKIEMDRTIYCPIPNKWYFSILVNMFSNEFTLGLRATAVASSSTIHCLQTYLICHMRRRRHAPTTALLMSCRVSELSPHTNTRTYKKTHKVWYMQAQRTGVHSNSNTQFVFCHLGFYDRIREHIPFFIPRRFIFFCFCCCVVFARFRVHVSRLVQSAATDCILWFPGRSRKLKSCCLLEILSTLSHQ